MTSSSDQPATDRRRTCVVADDHPLMLDALAQLLEWNGFAVVACVGNGHAALAAAREHEPDLALLDEGLPLASGTEVAGRARADGLRTSVVLFTGQADRALLVSALDAGVRGVVLKQAGGGDVVRALEAVAAGGSYVDPLLAGELTGLAAGGRRALLLSVRERQVLGLVANGLTNDQIADGLAISGETVRTHVRRAMTKLGAGSRTEAVATALRRSLIA